MILQLEEYEVDFDENGDWGAMHGFKPLNNLNTVEYLYEGEIKTYFKQVTKTKKLKLLFL